MVRTFGCQMNEHDSERLAGLLEADGYQPVDSESEADVVILNTCCIRENADSKLYGTLGHLKSVKDNNPDLEIMVGGCLAQKDRDLITEKAPHVGVVFGTHNVGRALELLEEHREGGEQVVEILEGTVAADKESFPSALPVVREVGWAAWVTIQIGCDNNCAFCIVPSVRGVEVSRPFGDIVREIEIAATDGVSEVTLLGQNVNSYGRDITLDLRKRVGSGGVPEPSEIADLAGRSFANGQTRARPLFADLLRAVGAIEGIERVRYTSPHPKDLRDDTIAAMAETDSVCAHLHLPLQSGSDRILAAMHRGYTADRYLSRLSRARAAIPDLAVSTDIIVGFPGETEREFAETLEVAAEARFDNAYTFVYSPRPGTEAAEMTAQFVDHGVGVERMQRLRAVVERSSKLAQVARIGNTETVIVEGPSKRNPDRLSGRTEHNRLVHFTPPAPIRGGSVVSVRIVEASITNMIAEFVEVVREPTHKTRIPVTAG